MKKDAAFKAVKQLQNMDLPKDAQKILASLYTFFLPKAPGKAAGPAAWVAKACSKDKFREVLLYLYAENGFLVATDGQRLHLAPTDLPNGFYNTALDLVENQNMQFPDFRRVIPTNGQAYTWTMTPPVENTPQIPWVYVLPCGNKVQQKYWDDARNGAETVEYTVAAVGDPLKITKDQTLAVIMPLRPEKGSKP